VEGRRKNEIKGKGNTRFDEKLSLSIAKAFKQG
jgi:hypothetical protein